MSDVLDLSTNRSRLAPPALALGAPAFVLLSLAGNSLTGVATGDSTLELLAAQADSVSFSAGLALELLGLVALLGVVVWAGTRLRGGAAPFPALTAVLAGAWFVSVKLASGSAVLGAVREHATLDEAAATAAVAGNDAAFVLAWVPFGLFVAALAALAGSEQELGRAISTAGIVVGSLTATLGVVGAAVADLAMPIPFLLCLAWLLVAGSRMALRRGPALAQRRR